MESNEQARPDTYRAINQELTRPPGGARGTRLWPIVERRERPFGRSL
jgi:hypothetical protein